MLRVATLNAWGMRGDWAARLPVFQQGFRELDADIVTLQETILSEQADQAAEMLGPDYHLAQQREREQDGQGITTASRHPFGQIFEVDFHVTGPHLRLRLHVPGHRGARTGTVRPGVGGEPFP
jgi:exonuclease III